MRLILPASILTLSVLSVSATAQISGSINSDAPTVTSSVNFKDSTKLHVSYTAIHFGEGKWQSILEATDRHERFNSFAEKKPIGMIDISAPVTASGREIAQGKYDLYFTVNEQAGWILNLKPKGEGKSLRWRMVMKETDSKNTRFSMTLNPGAETGSCNIAIAFGQKMVEVPLKIGKAMKKMQKKAGVR